MTSLSLAAGCKQGPAPAATPAKAASGSPVLVSIGNRVFRLEVAATDLRRQMGLMHRTSLAEDAGMVFVFPKEQPLSFWMRNTTIPLDILYLDATGKVVSIRELTPLDEDGVSSVYPARYAIELNRGTAAKTGVKVGDVLKLPTEVTAPADLE